MNFKKFWAALKDTFKGFGEDKVMRLSAALAYYAMFSIGPLLVIAVGLAGLAFEHDAVRSQIHSQLQGTLGETAARTVESMMTQKRSTSLITTIVGIVALLCGAGGVFGQLQDALNTIWGVKPKPGRGLWAMIRDRFLSLAMVLGIGFLLLVSMVLTTVLAAMSDSLGSRLPISTAIVHIVNLVVSLGVITLLFAMIFKYLPDVKIPFRVVWIGAIGTALLFTAGKYVLARYLGRESTTSPYGAAGAVIGLLLWVFYASVILFVGAEFTRAYAKVMNVKIVPAKFAVPVSAEARREEGMDPKENQPAMPPRRPALASPGMVISQRPWSFLGMMAAAGFAGGLLMTLKSARTAAQVFTTVVKGAQKLQALTHRKQ